MIGKTIYAVNNYYFSGNIKLEINSADYKSGIYLLSIVSNEGLKTIKIVKK